MMTKQNNISCPACGSENVQTLHSEQQISVVYGSPACFNEIINECLNCGETGDFSGKNDQQVENALDVARKQSVINMLEYLSSKNIKMSYMERALELPARTIARWKAGEVSAASLALLRIIRTFPWLLEVADEKFDKNFVRYKVVNEAGQILHDSFKLYNPSYQYDTGQNKITVIVSYNMMNSPKFSEKALTPKIEGRPASIGLQ
jgi:hypothetical protein